MATFAPITIWQGDTVGLEFTVVDADGAVFDLSGGDLVFRVYSVDGTLSLASADDEIMVDEETGVVSVSIDATTTGGLSASLQHRYDLRLFSGDEVKTLAYGVATIQRWIDPDA